MLVWLIDHIIFTLHDKQNKMAQVCHYMNSCLEFFFFLNYNENYSYWFSNVCILTLHILLQYKSETTEHMVTNGD